MTRVRDWRARLVPAVLTAFLVGGVVPRGLVYAHRHPGGEATHVHAWEPGAPRTAVPVRRAGAPDRRAPGIRASDEAGWHVHSQQPFQLGTLAEVADASRIDALEVVDILPTEGPRSCGLPLPAARAPPPLPA